MSFALTFARHRCHMFYPRRVLDINDGKPKWTGINNTSELIADSPAETVKKRKREKNEEDEEDKEKEKEQEHPEDHEAAA